MAMMQSNGVWMVLRTALLIAVILMSLNSGSDFIQNVLRYYNYN